MEDGDLVEVSQRSGWWDRLALRRWMRADSPTHVPAVAPRRPVASPRCQEAMSASGPSRLAGRSGRARVAAVPRSQGGNTRSDGTPPGATRKALGFRTCRPQQRATAHTPTAPLVMLTTVLTTALETDGTGRTQRT